MTQDKIDAIKAYLLARLGEVSTWQGIILAVTVAGVQLSPAQQSLIVNIGLGLGGLVSILKAEGKV